MKRIHFINRLYSFNAGDHYGSVIDCVPEFLEKGFCIKHDITKIKYKHIQKGDVVIIGGGGLLNNNNNKAKWDIKIHELISRFDKGHIKLVIWGAGVHTYPHVKNKLKFPINWEDFDLVGIRDFNFIDKKSNNKIPYVPCSTCTLNQFDKSYEICREFGVIKQHLNEISDIDISHYDSIGTFVHINNLINFIGTSEILLTNSYHATYWAQLLNRKVVLVNADWANKFDYMKNGSTIVRFSGDLYSDANKAKLYPDFLNESRKITNEFKEKVFNLLDE